METLKEGIRGNVKDICNEMMASHIREQRSLELRLMVEKKRMEAQLRNQQQKFEAQLKDQRKKLEAKLAEKDELIEEWELRMASQEAREYVATKKRKVSLNVVSNIRSEQYDW